MVEISKFTWRVLVGKHREMRISHKGGGWKPLWLSEVVLEVRQVHPGKSWGKNLSPLGRDDVWLIQYMHKHAYWLIYYYRDKIATSLSLSTCPSWHSSSPWSSPSIPSVQQLMGSLRPLAQRSSPGPRSAATLCVFLLARCRPFWILHILPSPCLQIPEAPAQGGEETGPKLWRPLPRVREWQQQGGRHGDSGGLPRAGPAEADRQGAIFVPADPGAARGCAGQDAGGAGVRAEEGHPPAGHSQDAAHLCLRHAGWHR